MEESTKKYYLAFGQHLQHLIDEHKRDVITIASVGNIEQKQVYRVLNGEHGASMKTILALAKGLGIPPKDLFDFKFEL